MTRRVFFGSLAFASVARCWHPSSYLVSLYLSLTTKRNMLREDAAALRRNRGLRGNVDRVHLCIGVHYEK